MISSFALRGALVLMLCARVHSYICDESATICETSLTIQHFLTMMHPWMGSVYPADGKLWMHDVKNISEATPVDPNIVISADGVERPSLVVVANMSMPGPDIIVYEGQMVRIHVHNKLASDTVSMHWHGLPLVGYPYMDGTAFLTQCPILPGNSFTYEFRATPKGTYWYHSHVGHQRQKGSFGALIIRERQVSNPLEEHFIQLQDWSHNSDGDYSFMQMTYGLFKDRQRLPNSASLDGALFTPYKTTSGLINGKGRFFDPSAGMYNEPPLEVFNVQSGRSYRFRVIHAGALYSFRVSVDGHMLSVVASDGHDVVPMTVESFIIFPGERFDFILHANQSVGNYWVRGETLEVATPHMAEAILHYAGTPDELPTSSRKTCTISDTCIVLNCPFSTYPEGQHTECLHIDRLRSVGNDDPAVPITEGKFKEFFLNNAFPSPPPPFTSINGRRFVFPKVSAISQPAYEPRRCEDEDCGEEKLCTCTHTLDIERDDTVQLVLINMGVGILVSHPMHLHGHSFQVLKMGFGNYNATSGQLLSQNSDVYCQGGASQATSLCTVARWSNMSWANGNVPDMEVQNPIRKDTIIVPTGCYVVIRFKADNPGLWLFHCHITLHLGDGMSLLFNESFSDIPRVPDGFPVCGRNPTPTEVPESTTTEAPVTNTIGEKNDDIEKETFWAVVAVLAVLVFLQLIVIFVLCQSRRHSLKIN